MTWPATTADVYHREFEQPSLGRNMYTWPANNGTALRSETIAGPRKTIITGLTMAGIYHFQIRAFGKLGCYTDWMDSKTFICA